MKIVKYGGASSALKLPSGAPQATQLGTTLRYPAKQRVWPQAGQRPMAPRPIAVISGGTGQGGDCGVRSGCQRTGGVWSGRIGLSFWG